MMTLQMQEIAQQPDWFAEPSVRLLRASASHRIHMSYQTIRSIRDLPAKGASNVKACSLSIIIFAEGSPFWCDIQWSLANITASTTHPRLQCPACQPLYFCNPACIYFVVFLALKKHESYSNYFSVFELGMFYKNTNPSHPHGGAKMGN